MLLDFFSTIKDWLTLLFQRFSWFSLIPLFTGLIMGIILSGLVYLIMIMTTVKKEQRLIKINETKVDDALIKKAILSAQNSYKEDSLEQSPTERLGSMKNISWELINDIAKMHYPEAKYPIYELSIEEMLMLNHYITKRIEHIFSGKILRKIKRVKISSIVKVLDIKKKADENKIVKAAVTTTRSKPVKFLITAVNFINPLYWTKKIINNAIVPAAVNKIANLIIEIIGEETKRVYSKNAFIEDELTTKIEEQINDLEQQIIEKETN